MIRALLIWLLKKLGIINILEASIASIKTYPEYPHEDKPKSTCNLKTNAGIKTNIRE